MKCFVSLETKSPDLLSSCSLRPKLLYDLQRTVKHERSR